MAINMTSLPARPERVLKRASVSYFRIRSSISIFALSVCGTVVFTSDSLTEKSPFARNAEHSENIISAEALNILFEAPPPYIIYKS